MLEKIEFTTEDGTNQKFNVTVFALSTCGFCSRGLQFLRTNKIKFKYVYVDKLDFDVKESLKKDIVEKYKERVVFPYLVVDEKIILTGFTEDDWKKALEVK